MFDLKKVSRMHVYEYEHIDERRFIQPPTKELLELDSNVEVAQLVAAVAELFKSRGWEGDGDIGIIWLPPFVEQDPDTHGSYIWHVKQLNNGTSWLASLTPLRFPRILDQND